MNRVDSVSRTPRDRTLRRLAVGGWLLTIGTTAGAIAIQVIGGAPKLPSRFSLGDAAMLAIALLEVVFATVGAIVLFRFARHVVGWLLLATGTFYAISILAGAFTFAAMASSSLGIEAARWSGWITGVTSTIAGVTLVATAFFFPDGHASSPRFARILRVLFLPAVVGMTLIVLQPGPMFLLTTLDNPVGLGPDFVGVLGPLTFPSLGAALAALTPITAVSVISRFRRSRGIERQQLKLFVAAAVVMIAALGLDAWFGFGTSSGSPVGEWPLVVFAIAATTVPLAVGVAVLRYRLYEIDRIISRTLAYTTLTAALAIVYVTAFVLLQAVLAPLTGSGGPLAVAASTLAVFALFQPLRRRLQAAMDRRFNRSRYDAQRTVEAFAAQLRDEVDLERVGGAVQSVVGQALAPASVGIWLRPSHRAVER